jgi:SAM-dependent methyltransferase
MTNIKEVEKQKYGQSGLRHAGGGGGLAREGNRDTITSNLCAASQTGAVSAAFGPGQPTPQLAGEVVLHLGSWSGIDVLLPAKRVDSTKNLDITDDMLALALENHRNAGNGNGHDLKAEIANIPFPDNSVDVIVSNRVINLSGRKDRMLEEAFRVLKPGGRLAVVVASAGVLAEVRESVELWIGRLAGALKDFESKLASAGFYAIDIEPARVHNIEETRNFLAGEGADGDDISPQLAGTFIRAFIRARKPAAGSCCGPDCSGGGAG